MLAFIKGWLSALNGLYCPLTYAQVSNSGQNYESADPL